MKTTVFGGSGFLGSHVCDKLSESGYDVTIFDLRPSPWLRADQKMILGNIIEEADVAKAVEGADFVFNFAGIADIGEANERAVDTVRYNVLGNAIILDACVKYQTKRYVFASSIYVYSKAGGFYRCSKQACESYIENYSDTCGLEYTVLRYGSLYGPRAGETNGIYRFIKEAQQTGKISYYGSPNALREYIHIEDAALCSVEILSPAYINQHIVLTGHQPMRVGDLFRMIAEIIGKPLEFEFNRNPQSFHYEVTPYSFSPKIGKKLAPVLHTDLGQGILRMVENIHKELHPELHHLQGYLVVDNS
ncbi:NAD(P)-dependent oxidoreductase [Deltaproteobacteria bacterium TL4]